MDSAIEFLRFIDEPGKQSFKDLLARVLLRARQMTGAEAGTIFVIRDNNTKLPVLEACSAQNDLVSVEDSNFTVPITLSSIAGFVALNGESLIINDLYNIPPDCTYTFDRNYDIENNYRSRSMLVFPITNFENDIIGIVQLINRRSVKTARRFLPFTMQQANMILPFNQIVGRAIERAEMLETIDKANKELIRKNKYLLYQKRKIELLSNETEGAFMLSIKLLAHAAEIHDEQTGNHIIRCNEYAFCLASISGMSNSFCEQIRYSAQLHDIGKMSVSSSILTKPGRLNKHERDEMNLHTTFGHQILQNTERLKMAAEIAHSHHEKWDGSGYPQGLSGNNIPMAARILSIVDVYDALRSKRSYKPAYSHMNALSIMTKGDDRIDPIAHFDPQLLSHFAKHHKKFDVIWKRFKD